MIFRIPNKIAEDYYRAYSMYVIRDVMMECKYTCIYNIIIS